MNLTKRIAASLVIGAAALGCSMPANAGFTEFAIRGTPIINTGPPLEFVTDDPGDKAALGSNDINGFRIGDITKLGIERVDDITRFSNGSGPNVAPYFNIWITDGAGHFAVVANEPSNPAFQALYNNGVYDLSFDDLSDKVAKIYETDDTSWLPNNGVGLTFADLATFVIRPPTPTEQASLTGIGTGAPRVLGTNEAFGVNWVFGDTLSNYVSGDPGFQVQNAVVAAAVPEPASLLFLGAGVVGLCAIRRRRRRS